MSGFVIGTCEGKPFSLPIDAATARFLSIGKGGYGKTNGDCVLIEGFVRGGVTTIVADPVGQMYGLRAGRDGEAAGGIDIAVLGGRRGDLPMPLESAEYFADMCGEGLSAVLDLSLIDPGDHEDFMDRFLPRFQMRVQGNGINAHVNFQEADRFAPQRPGATVTATTRWARAVRNIGIGWSFSTHRMAIIDKAIAETANVFQVYRMTGAVAQETIGKHVASIIGKAGAKALLGEQVARLRKGEVLIIPDSDWLDDGREWDPVRVQLKLRDTFEIRAPRPGEQKREPKSLRDFDIDKIKEQFAVAAAAGEVPTAPASAPSTKAASPAAAPASGYERGLREERERADRLRAELERVTAEREKLESEVRALRAMIAETRARLREIAEGARRNAGEAQSAESALTYDDVATVNGAPVVVTRPIAAQSREHAKPKREPSVRVGEARVREGAPPSTGLKDGARRILAMLYRAGRPLTRFEASTLAVVSKGGTLSDYVRALKAGGFITENGDRLHLTRTGDALARRECNGTYEPPATTEIVQLHAGHIKGGAKRMLQLLIAAHPHPIRRAELAERAEVSKGGTLSDYARSLKARGLAEETPAGMAAAPILFIAEAR